MTRLLNGEFAVTNNIMTNIDFIHLDHSRSERERRLIANDPARARPEGRGLHFIQPCSPPTGVCLTVDIT